MQKHVVLIHGGEVFDTYEEYLNFLKNIKIDAPSESGKKWKDLLAARLGEQFVVIAPRMPNSFNAKYSEWKIWFEKYIPHIQDNIVLIGHSLGGIFLAKYLSENSFPKKIKSVFFVAAPFWNMSSSGVADFILGENVRVLEDRIETIHFYHSEDDPIVPFSNLLEYMKFLPHAQVTTFKDRGHFIEDNLGEIVEDIKKL
jgi:predicted alpha/beta hydrolase family esterase